MQEFLQSTGLLLVLLNPFLVVIYLVDVVQKVEAKRFYGVLVRAGIISSVVFCCFAIAGDAIFSELMQVDFASFQIFGGIVFLLIGLQFVFQGPSAITMLRGESEHLAGAIAMPVLVGPGTISACVVIGKRNEMLTACAAVLLAVSLCLITIGLLKTVHDHFRTRNERAIERYIEIAGRVTALYVGTIAVQMIMEGTEAWIGKFLSL